MPLDLLGFTGFPKVQGSVSSGRRLQLEALCKLRTAGCTGCLSVYIAIISPHRDDCFEVLPVVLCRFGVIAAGVFCLVEDTPSPYLLQGCMQACDAEYCLRTRWRPPLALKFHPQRSGGALHIFQLVSILTLSACALNVFLAFVMPSNSKRDKFSESKQKQSPALCRLSTTWEICPSSRLKQRKESFFGIPALRCSLITLTRREPVVITSCTFLGFSSIFPYLNAI